MPVRGCWRRSSTLLLAIVCCSADRVGAQEAKPSDHLPTCALVDFDRSPLTAVLEAKLLADVDADWLERSAIDEVLKEQELQALFTPEGGTQRAALGKLLKADLLILVREAPPPVENEKTASKEKPVPALDLAVTETRRGLRLIARTVPRSDDAEADAELMVRLVREALAKHAQKVTEIYAVPAFVSRDLGYEHDYLRGAYARLLEQLLLDRPGALAVEFAEAQSLAKEVALADPGSRLTRDVPFYLLGEYRNDGQANDRRVGLVLKLMRGEQRLGERPLRDVKPDEAAAALRKAAGELVGKAAGAKQVAIDPATEVEALNRREKLFLRLGQWSDALALAEASLLLKPDQEPLLVDAIVAATALCDQNWNIFPIALDRLRRAVSYDRRGLEHLERFAAVGGLPQTYDERGVGGFVSRLLSVTLNDRINRGYEPERNAIIIELQNLRQAALLRVIPQAARLNWKYDEFLVARVMSFLPLEKQFDLAFQLIMQVKDFPGTGRRTIAYSRMFSFSGHIAESHDLFMAYYDRLAAVANAEVQAAARQLKRDMQRLVDDYRRQQAEEEQRRMAEAERRAKAKPIKGIREVEFAWQDASGQAGRLKSFQGCMPIRAGLDVVWTGSQIFLMREPGRLTRVFPGAEWFGIDMLVANSGHARICYDGKYVWAAMATHREQPPRLIVLDPDTEKCAELTAADGLPVRERALQGVNQRQFIAVAPLAPGKVCLAGYFGQTWLAVAEFDEAGKKSVRVFHEARDAWDQTSQRQFSDVQLAFQPTYMLKLAEIDGDGRRTPRIVVGRGEVDHACPPLVIEPRTLAVSTAPIGMQLTHQIPSSDTKNAVSDEGIYTIKPPRLGAQPAICRAALPRLEFKPVKENVPPGFIAMNGNEVHIIGRGWWMGRLGDAEFRCIAETVPWWYSFGWFVSGRPADPPLTDEVPELKRVFRSSHYGILEQRAWSKLHPETTFEARELLAKAGKE